MTCPDLSSPAPLGRTGRRRLLALLLWCCCAIPWAQGIVPPAAAAEPAVPVVAVLPFRDLSGQKGSIGEALRETVTADLRALGGVRVVERQNLDKILAEQNLNVRSAEPGADALIKVGKLLGASLVAAGSFQQVGKDVRLIGRFIKVETGEITGTAKVDGQAGDLLKLQDRVTEALLRSAGLPVQSAQKVVRRQRPRLKSLKSVALYGDAVLASDDGKKRELLQEALREDPGFSYASQDLLALEKRLSEYSATARVEQDRLLIAFRERIKNETDPSKLNAAYMEMLSSLMAQRRYHQFLRESRAALDHPPPPAPPPYPPLFDYIYLTRVTAHEALRDHDSALFEGELFLKNYPSSPYFQAVKSTMDRIINQREREAQGKARVQEEVARLSPERRADPCILAAIYQRGGQTVDVIPLHQACYEAKHIPFELWLLFSNHAALGHFKIARDYLAQMAAQKTPDYLNAKMMIENFPTDE